MSQKERLGNHALCSVVARRLEDFDIDGPLPPNKKRELEILFSNLEDRVMAAILPTEAT